MRMETWRAGAGELGNGLNGHWAMGMLGTSVYVRIHACADAVVNARRIFQQRRGAPARRLAVTVAVQSFGGAIARADIARWGRRARAKSGEE